MRLLLLYVGFLVLQGAMQYVYMYKNHSLKQKMLTSAVFLTAGLTLFFAVKGYHSAFCGCLLAGLVLSFVGDATLHLLVGNINGLPGIVCFALAHVLYSVAWLMLSPPSRFSWILVPLLIILWGVEYTLLGKSGISLASAKIPVYIYAAFIDAMVILGVRSGLKLLLTGNSLNVFAGVLMISGTLLFLLSDGAVAFLMFSDRQSFTVKNKTFSIDRFGALTYFSAQVLLAGTLLLYM